MGDEPVPSGEPQKLVDSKEAAEPPLPNSGETSTEEATGESPTPTCESPTPTLSPAQRLQVYLKKQKHLKEGEQMKVPRDLAKFIKRPAPPPALTDEKDNAKQHPAKRSKAENTAPDSNTWLPVEPQDFGTHIPVSADEQQPPKKRGRKPRAKDQDDQDDAKKPASKRTRKASKQQEPGTNKHDSDDTKKSATKPKAKAKAKGKARGKAQAKGKASKPKAKAKSKKSQPEDATEGEASATSSRRKRQRSNQNPGDEVTAKDDTKATKTPAAKPTKTDEAKAKYSRKSAAYHRAMREARNAGASEEECKEAAKAVP